MQGSRDQENPEDMIEQYWTNTNSKGVNMNTEKCRRGKKREGSGVKSKSKSQSKPKYKYECNESIDNLLEKASKGDLHPKPNSYTKTYNEEELQKLFLKIRRFEFPGNGSNLLSDEDIDNLFLIHPNLCLETIILGSPPKHSQVPQNINPKILDLFHVVSNSLKTNKYKNKYPLIHTERGYRNMESVDIKEGNMTAYKGGEDTYPRPPKLRRVHWRQKVNGESISHVGGMSLRYGERKLVSSLF